MEDTIYQNNEVKITYEVVDTHEAKINVNGENLIWISRETKDEFVEQLKNLLDNFRI